MITRFLFNTSTRSRLLLTGSLAMALIALTAVGVPVAEPAPTYTMLSNLGTNAGDLTYPMTILVQGRDGNLYGTSTAGGANGPGTVFRLTTDGKVQVLHSFDGTDGSIGSSAAIVSSNGLTLGTDGRFYGTTFAGGESVQGIVFKISTDGTFTMLHNFSPDEGCCAMSPPVEGKDGNFYGVTGNSGISNFDGGAYKITPSGTLTILYRFDNSNPSPVAMTLGTDGNFYGTTPGVNSLGGSVFKITPQGSLTVLHTFMGTDGLHPWAQSSKPTTETSTGPPGTADRALMALFTKSHQPVSSPISLRSLEACQGNPRGMLFEITSSGKYAVVHNFPVEAPVNSLFQHTNGTLYGANHEGGTKFRGDLYSLNVGLEPFVRFLPPDSSASVGDTIGLLGQGFNATDAVSFNGTSASFTVVSDTYLTATVPSGATTGPVTVRTSGRTQTSDKTFELILRSTNEAAPSAPAPQAEPTPVPPSPATSETANPPTVPTALRRQMPHRRLFETHRRRRRSSAHARSDGWWPSE